MMGRGNVLQKHKVVEPLQNIDMLLEKEQSKIISNVAPTSILSSQQFILKPADFLQ